jgi:beta-lactamase superfamily II metal-dependent hydrolase
VIVDIYDVGHGACAVVHCPNGKRIMIDCGHSTWPEWRPSVAYAGLPIEVFVVSNYDEDHVSDLPNLLARVPVRFIARNPTVRSSDLMQLKMEYGADAGIRRLMGVMRCMELAPPLTTSADLGTVSGTIYWNPYPYFDDENNLSLVTIIEWAGFKILFGGDLEKAGWQNLLRLESFRRNLAGIDVYVASHHGRESGCCDDVLRIARPQIVVMSDRDRIYETQNTTNWYQARTSGIYDTSAQETRHVYTTRCDGALRISVYIDSASVTRWRVVPHSRILKAS